MMRTTLVLLSILSLSICATDFPSYYSVDIVGTDSTNKTTPFSFNLKSQPGATLIQQSLSNKTILTYQGNHTQYFWPKNSKDECYLNWVKPNTDDANLLEYINENSKALEGAICKEGNKMGKLFAVNFPEYPSTFPWANTTNVCVSSDGKIPYWISSQGSISRSTFKNFRSRNTLDKNLDIPSKCHPTERLKFPKEFSYKYGQDGVATVNIDSVIVKEGGYTYTYFMINDTLYSDYGCLCIRKSTPKPSTDIRSPLTHTRTFKRTGGRCSYHGEDGYEWGNSNGYHLCATLNSTYPLYARGLNQFQPTPITKAQLSKTCIENPFDEYS